MCLLLTRATYKPKDVEHRFKIHSHMYTLRENNRVPCVLHAVNSRVHVCLICVQFNDRIKGDSV